MVISVHTVRVHFFYIIGVTVTIGLEQATYSVGEADGSQKVCVVVKNGKPDREILVSFRTEDNTAVGRCSSSNSTHCLCQENSRMEFLYLNFPPKLGLNQ